MTDQTRDLCPGVLLDVDGTLLDTNYLHVLAWWRAFRDTGRTVPMRAIHRSVGIASEGLVEHLLGSLDEAAVEEAVEAHSRRYDELREQDAVVALPGAADLIRACQERGLSVVIATSGKEKDLDWMLPAIGAEEHLTGVVTSSQVEAGKPRPDLLGAAIERHRLDPARTVMVGDTVWDVEAAERAGVPCLGVLSGGIAAGELTDAGAVEVYDDAADLVARLERSRIGSL